MINSNTEELEAKRQDVRRLYVRFGVNSPEYEKAFDELHELNMCFMACNYANAHGQSQCNPNNPYK